MCNFLSVKSIVANNSNNSQRSAKLLHLFQTELRAGFFFVIFFLDILKFQLHFSGCWIVASKTNFDLG